MSPAAFSSAFVQDRVIRIRQFENEDLPAVVQLFKDGMMSYEEHLQHPELMSEYFEQSVNGDLGDIVSTYIKPGGNFWVATVTEEDCKPVIAGMVALEAKPDRDGELRRMSVKAEYRRDGIGRMLVTYLERWARENGFATVSLSTGGVMRKAQRFYLSMGYKHTKTVVISEEPRFEALCFLKQLY